MKQLIERIRAIVDSENVLVDEPMSAHTTFRVGGPADCFVMPRTIDELVKVLDLVRTSGQALFVMGRGSNLLVSDEGLRGVVVQIANNLSDVQIDANGLVKAEAGASTARKEGRLRAKSSRRRRVFPARLRA